VLPEMLTFLLEQNQNHWITFFKWQGRIYPLIGAYKKAAAPLLLDCIERDILRAGALTDLPNVQVIDLEDNNYFNRFDLTKAFANLNTKEEFYLYELNQTD